MKPLAIAPRRESLKRPAPQTGPSAITHPLCFHYQALHRYYPEGPPNAAGGAAGIEPRVRHLFHRWATAVSGDPCVASACARARARRFSTLLLLRGSFS